MAHSGSMIGSDYSHTFSSSQGESSLYDSGDSLNVLHFTGVPCLQSLRPRSVYGMSTPRGTGSALFPARGLHGDDRGPCSGHLPRQREPEYEDIDRDIFEEEFDDGLHDGNFTAQRIHGQMPFDSDNIRGRGTPHNDWEGDDNLMTSGMQRLPTGMVPGIRSQNIGYTATPPRYIHGGMSPTEQERTHGIVRGESFQPHSAVPWRDSIEEQSKRRRLQRHWTRPYLLKMAAAHAERQSLLVHVPTTTTARHCSTFVIYTICSFRNGGIRAVGFE
ncbi:hypothetical protein KC19_VG154000 [Ceratodon purpureus]|uniref:Uncharacterized protein n=1 Tax=Ceratodon purpureus TaxID=3225 RepID=A0A8T0HQP1_CERPU|nr:hypothetical protein KC19_VG154000 [Ceratodon purpureus]